MRALALSALMALALVACKPEPGPPRLEPVGAARVEAERKACEADGGIWSSGAFGSICARRTKDANQSCRKESDCEGVCLARSMTCAPVRPLLGCNEVLTDAGTRATLCVD
ncbi:hypothetical protein [Pseudothioclava arenosa]|uniref:Lipoprotein n=1 Tax=Pseudothioclava arenosa TaxID=1795308 RepID=A0A2A4CTE2_9RHOB|nr:hypothetical protein [Pseudothioclava arenosa]PCD77406.1 hypothetical protein CLN94_02520 [Pseudothioclava arenosa]